MFISFGVLMMKADVVDDFFRFLASNLPSVMDGDRMRWKLTKNGDFNIHSFYHKLHGFSSIVFPWKGIWKVKAPRRVSLFGQLHGIGSSWEIS